jgi:hypothetical protein
MPTWATLRGTYLMRGLYLLDPPPALERCAAPPRTSPVDEGTP